MSKENALIKKHHKEIRRINDQHQSEVQNLKSNHGDQVRGLSDRMRDDSARRETRHSKQIEGIRELNRKNLKSMAMENEEKLSVHRESVQSDGDRSKDRYGKQLKELTRSFQSKITQQQRSHEDSINSLRKTQKDSIKSSRNKLVSSHEKEIKSVRKDKNFKVSNLQSQLSETRQNTNLRLRNQELQHFSTKKRLTDNAMDSVRRERAARVDSEAMLRDGFNEAVDKIDEKHNKARQKERLANITGIQDIRRTVGEKQTEKINYLERKIVDLKDKGNREQLKTKRMSDKRVANVKEEYTKNIDLYRVQKDEIQEAANENVAKEIKKIREETSDTIQFSNRFQRNRAQMQDYKSRTAVSNIRNDLQTRLDRESVGNDMKRKQLRNDQNKQLTKMDDYYRNNLTEIKRQNDEEKDKLREVVSKEKDVAVSNLQKRVVANEKKSNERVLKAQEKYTNELDMITDNNTEDKRKTAASHKRSMKEVKKAHAGQMDSVKYQYDQKLAEVNEQHDREVVSMNKKHQVQVNNILNVAKKS